MASSTRSPLAAFRHFLRGAAAVSIVAVLAGTTPGIVPDHGAARPAILATVTLTSDPEAGRSSEPPSEGIARRLPRRESR